MKVFIDKEFADWILGSIIRDSAAYSKKDIEIISIRTRIKSWLLSYITFRLKHSRTHQENLFVNQNTFLWLCKNKILRISDIQNSRIFFTHASLSEYDKTEIDFLNAVSEIVVMNSSDEMNLEKHGIDKPTKSVCYGAISDDIFFPSKSLDNDKFVYVSGDVKLRKNPSKILEVMEKNPEIKFVVFGNNWRLYLLQESPHLPNVKWAAGSLKDSGFYMQKAHCYLSLSDLEGGPYGTIEALSSGTPVVCTPTGWNPEIINNENGVIVGFDANVSMIRQAIERAFEIKKTIYDRNVLNPIFNFPRQSRVLFKEN